MNNRYFIVEIEDLYLTFLTPNDSYMKKVPKGTILGYKAGDLVYDGKSSIDNEVGLLYHKYIREITEAEAISATTSR